MTELIVIHGISLPPGEYGGQEIEALYEQHNPAKLPKVSAMLPL